MRIITLLAASAIVAQAHAQIPNGGFESWDSNPNYSDPTSWWTTNAVTWTLVQTPSCVQASPGAVGNHHIALTSMNAAGIVEIGRATCGDQSTGYPGFPYAARPGNFQGQVQYAPQGADQGIVHASLWGWNSNMTAREVIAVATYNVTFSINTWLPFSVPFTYLSQSIPDTARVYIEASGTTPVNGSTIRVDDLRFDGINAIGEVAAVQGFRAFPSLATEQVTITAAEPLARITVCDANGRVVLVQAASAQRIAIDVSAWPTGVYALRALSAAGGVGVQRFVKE